MVDNNLVTDMDIVIISLTATSLIPVLYSFYGFFLKYLDCEAYECLDKDFFGIVLRLKNALWIFAICVVYVAIVAKNIVKYVTKMIMGI